MAFRRGLRAPPGALDPDENLPGGADLGVVERALHAGVCPPPRDVQAPELPPPVERAAFRGWGVGCRVQGVGCDI